MVIDIAALAASFIPGGGAIATAVRAVATNAPKAKIAAKTLSPVVPIVAPIANKAKEAVAENVPQALSKGANRISEVAKGAASVAEKKKDEAVGALRDAVDVRAQEKARRAARKAILDGAGIRMSSADFCKNWDAQSNLEGQGEIEYLDYIGCYAVITCDRAVKKGDYSNYRDVFVGKSRHMGASIHNDFFGYGNVDVYADVKYDQNVYVLLYPCAEEKLDQLETSLIVALDADESYNRLNQWHL